MLCLRSTRQPVSLAALAASTAGDDIGRQVVDWLERSGSAGAPIIALVERICCNLGLASLWKALFFFFACRTAANISDCLSVPSEE
jgi:hypothetical protein